LIFSKQTSRYPSIQFPKNLSALSFPRKDEHNFFIYYVVAEIRALKNKKNVMRLLKNQQNQTYAMANCNQDTNNLQYQNLINVK